MRHLLRTLVLPIAALALAACSGATTDAPTVDPAIYDPASTPAAASPSEAPSTTASASPSADPASEDAQPSDGTTFPTLWVASTWTVEERTEDLCASGAMVSPYTLTGDEQYVMCGPNAADTKACAMDGPGDTVTCIVDPLQKTAIRFPSPTLASGDAEIYPREGEPIPLYVALPDGVNCAPIGHDHDQHFEGMFSWYRCEDGSELLTPNDIDATFERGEPWTVQRSRDGLAPEATAVTAAVFAEYEG